MKTTHLFHWFAAATVAASLPVTAARAMSGHNGGGFAGGGIHGSSGHGSSHQFGSRHDVHDHRFADHRFADHRFADHRFADRRFFDHDRGDFFFRHHRRFFFGFDFVGFGFPYWWYPDYYYGYPYGYASYDYSPVYYDYRYWYGLSTAVQTELARLGYYHGPIDGEINSGSREAIRSFQRAEGLPVTGLIDPRLLRALKLPAVPRVATSSS